MRPWWLPASTGRGSPRTVGTLQERQATLQNCAVSRLTLRGGCRRKSSAAFSVRDAERFVRAIGTRRESCRLSRFAFPFILRSVATARSRAFKTLAATFRAPASFYVSFANSTDCRFHVLRPAPLRCCIRSSSHRHGERHAARCLFTRSRVRRYFPRCLGRTFPTGIESSVVLPGNGSLHERCARFAELTLRRAVEGNRYITFLFDGT